MMNKSPESNVDVLGCGWRDYLKRYLDEMALIDKQRPSNFVRETSLFFPCSFRSLGTYAEQILLTVFLKYSAETSDVDGWFYKSSLSHWGFSDELIRRSIKKFLSDGKVEVRQGMKPEDIVEFLCNKQPQILLDGAYPYNTIHCYWCGAESFSLEEHHYPIYKSAGGIATVSICRNCHAEFHFLENKQYRLSPNVKSYLEQ